MHCSPFNADLISISIDSLAYDLTSFKYTGKTLNKMPYLCIFIYSYNKYVWMTEYKNDWDDMQCLAM